MRLGLAITGVAFGLGSVTSVSYYRHAAEDYLATAEQHSRVVSLEREIAHLKVHLADCVPKEAKLQVSTSECIEAKVRYDTIQEEHRTILNSQKYGQEVSQYERMMSKAYQLGFSLFFVSASLIAASLLKRKEEKQ